MTVTTEWMQRMAPVPDRVPRSALRAKFPWMLIGDEQDMEKFKGCSTPYKIET